MYIKKDKCPFCDPDILRKETWYETKYFRCICSLKPVLPGHSMIIPKRHSETFLDFTPEESAEFMDVLKLAIRAVMKSQHAESFSMGVQDSEVAGASVEHTHVHIVPRRQGDIDGDPSNWWAMLVETESERPELTDAQMAQSVELLKKTVKEMSFVN